jgi:hypothetical protein
MTARQSDDASSKPKRCLASWASSSLTSTTTLRCGTAGGGQKNIGIAAYAMACAFPMKPPPIIARLSVLVIVIRAHCWSTAEANRQRLGTRMADARG